MNCPILFHVVYQSYVSVYWIIYILQKSPGIRTSPLARNWRQQADAQKHTPELDRLHTDTDTPTRTIKNTRVPSASGGVLVTQIRQELVHVSAEIIGQRLLGDLFDEFAEGLHSPVVLHWFAFHCRVRWRLIDESRSTAPVTLPREVDELFHGYSLTHDVSQESQRFRIVRLENDVAIDFHFQFRVRGANDDFQRIIRHRLGVVGHDFLGHDIEVVQHALELTGLGVRHVVLFRHRRLGSR